MGKIFLLREKGTVTQHFSVCDPDHTFGSFGNAAVVGNQKDGTSLSVQFL